MIIYVGKPVIDHRTRQYKVPDYTFIIATGPHPGVCDTSKTIRITTGDVRDAWRLQREYVAANGDDTHPGAFIATPTIERENS